ncbi:MAG: Multiple EGF-like-domain protein 3, partial [Parcubacteria group bacterium GW2011_GWA2_38_13]
MTIFGRNFGARGPLSRVEFDSDPLPGADASGAETWVNARIADFLVACPDAWSDDRIIVEVPNLGGLGIRGPIRVTKDDGGIALIDSTNDVSVGERKILDFNVTNITLPGICQITPDEGFFKQRVSLGGINFDAPDIDNIRFGPLPVAQGFIIASDNTINNIEVPNLAANTIAWVTAGIGTSRSNALPFKVTSGDNQPIIYRYTPYPTDPAPNNQGAVGDYVTIIGANFGTDAGRVFFSNGTDPADIIFPNECPKNYWTNTRIIVKVPAGATDGYIRVVRNDLNSTDTRISGLLDFDIGGNPKPGICALMPESGPAGITDVKIYGERLATAQRIKFYNAADLIPADFNIVGAHIEDATVPTEAQTGDVFVFDGAANRSNGFPFTVGACINNNSCADPATQECCLSGEFAKSCVPKGECSGIRNRGAYRWSFVAGNMGPHVVYDCQRTNSCKQICIAGTPNSGKACAQDTDCGIDNAAVEECGSPISSPAPDARRDGKTDADRDGVFDGVPVNSVITATFSEDMNDASITYTGNINDSIVVHECLNGPGNDPGITVPCNAATLNNFTLTNGQKIYNGANVDYFELVPPANLNPATPAVRDFKPDTWYQVELKATDDPNAMRSAKAIELNGNNGPTSNYIWRFYTRANNTAGNVGCIDCQPKVQLDGSAHTWAWTVEDAAFVDAAELAGGSVTDDIKQAVAKAETQGHFVKTTIETGHATQCTIKVDLTTPVVEAYKPNCGSACANAAMYVKFNKEMKHTDVAAFDHLNVNTVLLYTCGGDYTCTTMQRQAITVPVCNDVGGKTECTFSNNETYSVGGSIYNFIPGNYYRVVLLKSIQSLENKNLGNLNFNEPGGIAEPDSFSYQFKVTTDPTLCALNSVVITPQNGQVPVGSSRVYTGNPYSKPDRCEPSTGQLLNAYNYDWQWKNPPDNIPVGTPVGNTASVTQVDTCGNGVREKGEDCDPPNVANGCSVNCLKTGTLAGESCGDNRVGLGEECDPPGALLYCANATCLHTGNNNSVADVCGNGDKTGMEECDDGNNTNNDGCSSTCVLEGTIAGLAVCGDGIVGPGEACEVCWTGGASAKTISGSCPNSDFATGHDGRVNQAGCATNCATDPAFAGVARRSPYPVCGNGVVEIGEDCDDNNKVANGGCGATCLNEGRAVDLYTQRAQGQFQLVTGVENGKANIETRAQNYEITFGPWVTGNTPAIIGTGIPGGGGLGEFHIVRHYPNGGDICQNIKVILVFSKAPDPTTITFETVANDGSNVVIDGPGGDYIIADKNAQIEYNGNQLEISPNGGDVWGPGNYTITINNPANILSMVDRNPLDCNGKCNDWTFEIVEKLCIARKVDVTVDSNHTASSFIVSPTTANAEPNQWVSYYAQVFGEYTKPV